MTLRSETSFDQIDVALEQFLLCFQTIVQQDEETKASEKQES